MQNFGPNTTTFVVPGEVFPTRYRSTAHGISAASGKFGAIIAQVCPLFSIRKSEKSNSHFFLLSSFLPASHRSLPSNSRIEEARMFSFLISLRFSPSSCSLVSSQPSLFPRRRVNPSKNFPARTKITSLPPLLPLAPTTSKISPVFGQ